MKKQEIIKKNQRLQLTKKTIAKLNSKELFLINGGKGFIGADNSVVDETACTGSRRPRCIEQTRLIGD